MLTLLQADSPSFGLLSLCLPRCASKWAEKKSLTANFPGRRTFIRHWARRAHHPGLPGLPRPVLPRPAGVRPFELILVQLELGIVWSELFLNPLPFKRFRPSQAQSLRRRLPGPHILH